MMSFSAISDLAGSWAMKRQQQATKFELNQSAKELTTGKKAMSKIADAGEIGRVFAIDKALETGTRYRQAMAQGQVRMEAAQASLATIRGKARDLSMGVLAGLGGQGMPSTMARAATAEGILSEMVSRLNGEVAGRALFAGAAVDRAALKSSDTILTDVRGIMAGAADPATALADVKAYFDDPAGGFATTIYQGSTEDDAPIAMANGESVAGAVRADAQPLRDALRQVAIIAAVSADSSSYSESEIRSLLNAPASENLSTNDKLITLQEKLGIDQELVKRGVTRNEAERMRLNVARNEVASADEFESAARFESLKVQMESIYTVTARLSKMSLINFLR